MDSKNFTFTVDDINLFASASHDHNPLHCDYGYARKTPYGDQVVHGILGVLVCLGRLAEINNKITLSQLKVKYWKPLFCNVSYNIIVNMVSESTFKIMMVDGEAKLLEIMAILADKMNKSLSPPPPIYSSPVKESNDVEVGDIKAGQSFDGEYSIEQNAASLLLKKFNLCGSQLENIFAILSWSSYFIGMIMPGQQALYSGLNLELDKSFTGLNTSMRYSVTIKKIDVRFNLLDMEYCCFYPDGNKIAYGNLSAFIRPKIKYDNSAATIVPIQEHNKLQGKKALITGASRGLGSVLAQIFAAMSCHVIVNFQYSLDEAVHLQKQIRDSGGIIDLWQGDIADIEWLNSKKEELVARGQEIDILVCNACQSPKEMIFEKNSISRIYAYINKNLEMVTSPLSVFTSMLNNNHGYGIIISSEYVSKPVALWPHYISVKAAIEGLTSSIALRYNKVHWFIVRPPKLLTDMSNSPIGNNDTADPYLIAKNICAHIFSDSQDEFESVEVFTPTQTDKI